MTYIFVFLGEFGFELLNWQGVIRKFAQTITPDDKIVCCSRANLYLLYESADVYIDISDVEPFRHSRASGYHAMPSELGVWYSLPHRRFDRGLKAELRTFILERLGALGEMDDNRPYTFVFSSEGTEVNGCKFGLVGYRRNLIAASSIDLYRRMEAALSIRKATTNKLRSLSYRILPTLDSRPSGGIYDVLALDNNIYKKTEPDLKVLPSVQKQLEWDLSEPFVLCQARYRATKQLSQSVLPRDKLRELIGMLAEEVRVVLMSFNTGRWLDSYSEFEDSPNCFRYHCTSFPEQACLIHFAKHCLFFTEGDLGSHIYVPPFMGKDVTAVAPRSIYELDSAPIDFWNWGVFRFGGQIVPLPAEEVLRSDSSMRQTVRQILSHEPLREAMGCVGRLPGQY